MFLYQHFVILYWIFPPVNDFKWEKFQLESFKSCQTLQLRYRRCLHSRLFENFKNLNLKTCEIKTNIYDSKQLQIKKIINNKLVVETLPETLTEWHERSRLVRGDSLNTTEPCPRSKVTNIHLWTGPTVSRVQRSTENSRTLATRQWEAS